MAVTWTEDLATGVAEIDDQHKELFVRINNLLEACNQGKGREEVGATVSFLEEYTETHFGAEELWMKKTQFPDSADHHKRHVEFTQNLRDVRRRLDEEGPGVHLIILTNQIVIEWLRNHIRTLDKALGAYLRRAEKSV
jgi:hemerythrin